MSPRCARYRRVAQLVALLPLTQGKIPRHEGPDRRGSRSAGPRCGDPVGGVRKDLLGELHARRNRRRSEVPTTGRVLLSR